MPKQRRSEKFGADGRAPSLGAADQDALGQALQAYYQALVSEPLPEALLAKLSALAAIEPIKDEISPESPSTAPSATPQARAAADEINGRGRRR
jgi:hypothetical protein